ncbi:MAG: ATPase, T2SS/T4P/T4SS family [Enterocloster clostridioformis]|nr:ATPase, T2SS/T4P/T4SS family [Enterocloster clostridioformis]
MPDKIPIENLLIDRGYLTRRQMDRVMRLKEGRPERSIEEILTEFGYVTEAALLTCAAVRDHMEVAPSGPLRADRKAAAVIEPSFAMRNRILPMRFEEECLLVAAAYPVSPDVLDEVATLSGKEVRAVLAPEKELRKALRKAYGYAPEHVYGENAYFPMETPGTAPEGSGSELSFMERVESAPVVRMVNAVIEDAFHKNASDIHVEPGRKDLVIRIRINGDLIVHTTLKMEYHRPMITRLKLMAGMDIAEKRLPQDGKYHYERGEVSTDLRISTLPSIYGEKAVLRLLRNDRDNSLMDIRRLGMEEEQRTVFEHILKAPHGMVLVTGPTGSGKTTTLYAALNRMVKKKINIVTVEDPVEKIMEGITQVQVNPKAGLTFASALRSILRQDPDVIMVGEMRDEETAAIGVRAAITGHLVLSTLHTNDCASTIHRLRNMGVPPYMAAASLSGIVAQRLVKLLCPNCREPYEPDGRERRIFAERRADVPDRLWRSAGCPLCGGTGYVRRTAVYEMMDVDEQIKAMILDNEPLLSIREYQEQKGSMPIRNHVLRMAARGETDMEEAEKILYSVQ